MAGGLLGDEVSYEAITDPGEPPAAVQMGPPIKRKRVILLIAASLAFVAILASIYASGKGKAKSAVSNQLLAAKQSPEIQFPYPEGASLHKIVICNHSGKEYWFFGAKGGSAVEIPPVRMGEGCSTISLTEACKDNACWHRGTLQPCQSGTCASRSVTAGVNVISGGEGSATCQITCPYSKLLCQASTAVFIAPAHCTDVKVTANKAVPPAEFPKHYNALPLYSFPYPSGLKPSSVTICNYSGRRYWYSWDDSTEAAWTSGPGHQMVEPLQPGERCQNAETAVSWHRGFIAPCPKSDKTCFKENVRTVTAGVNVMHAAGGGQAACTVHCNLEVDTCRTAAVVVISPARCERVRVTAG